MKLLSSPVKQRGATLVIALVFLLMLLILALASSQVGIQQERMTGNYRESNEAFQSAEATVREVEACLHAIYQRGLSPFCDVHRMSWLQLEQEMGIPTGELNDCSLSSGVDDEDALGGDWAALPWANNASNPDNQYLVVNLDGSGKCKPVGEPAGPAGGEATYLLVARAPGPAETGFALVQDIFYWKP